ncbi:ATP-dependent helicase HrpB [Idiomarina piscisalsi]|uniref:ATP-dependent helicase HrpB n=1 Tax=Idiomarina piscisalsi TaxID=1096243 RepID=UPI00137CE585|nr:ATP-dependent helicase HrpB [Idiomarina piscisalsi]MTJ01858.1 ATP-dependent helicase HrpB [Idiomarina piscisalsi]
MTLPVENVLPALAQCFPAARVVLEAPPGAGKSTYLPLYLLREQLGTSGITVMLQPRRVAAVNVANYLAKQLNEPVGETVGYIVRGETKRAKTTKLIVVTEGVLVRWLQEDPELSDISTLIFDEFHERNLHSDLSLALVIDALPLREDLNLLIMSATLPAKDISEWLSGYCDGVTTLSSEGRSFPIDIQYRAPQQRSEWLLHLPSVIVEALGNADKGVLVFLPGIYEIERAQQALSSLLATDVSVYTLHSRLSLKAQQHALKASDGKRIILATNIAETSLTIEGIDVVVDSGRERRANFLPGYGMNQLTTHFVSRASATQRAGRAGRLQPGTCYRAWSKADEHGQPEYAKADIETQDVTSVVLEALKWGSSVSELAWFTPPNPVHCRVAEQFLSLTGLLHDKQLTGKAISLDTGTDVRLALICAAANETGDKEANNNVKAACARALATLEEPSPQIKTVNILESAKQHYQQRQSLSRWRRRWQYWLQRLRVTENTEANEKGAEPLLIAGFPDRLAKYTETKRSFQLVTGGRLSPVAELLSQPQWAIIFEATFQEGNSTGKVRRYVEVSDISDAIDAAGLSVSETHSADWLGTQQTLTRVRRQVIGALTLSEEKLDGSVSHEERCQAFAEYLNKKGLETLHWSRKANQLLARIRLLQSVTGELSDYPLSPEGLLSNLEVWAYPYWHSLKSLSQLEAWEPCEALTYWLNYDEKERLDNACPEHWQTPTQRKIFINYLDGTPRVEVKLQEMFGVKDSPRIIDAQQVVAVDLLSPAGRLLQRTNDLNSFWGNAYQEVRKEMRGRYPKHPWPEDPINAEATYKTKRQMQ